MTGMGIGMQLAASPTGTEPPELAAASALTSTAQYVGAAAGLPGFGVPEELVNGCLLYTSPSPRDS